MVAMGASETTIVKRIAVRPSCNKHVDDLCVALLGRRRYSTALIPSFVYPPILVLMVSNSSLDWRGCHYGRRYDNNWWIPHSIVCRNV